VKESDNQLAIILMDKGMDTKNLMRSGICISLNLDVQDSNDLKRNLYGKVEEFYRRSIGTCYAVPILLMLRVL